MHGLVTYNNNNDSIAVSDTIIIKMVVVSDASNYRITSVILLNFPDGNEKVIVHISRFLIPAQYNYGQIEEAALEIMFVIKMFHKMLYECH